MKVKTLLFVTFSIFIGILWYDISLNTSDKSLKYCESKGYKGIVTVSYAPFQFISCSNQTLDEIVKEKYIEELSAVDAIEALIYIEERFNTKN